MGLVNSVLGKFLGNKSERDIKEIQPYVVKTLAEYDKLSGLSNDDLREKSQQLKQKVLDYIKPYEENINELKNSHFFSPYHLAII